MCSIWPSAEKAAQEAPRLPRKLPTACLDFKDSRLTASAPSSATRGCAASPDATACLRVRTLRSGRDLVCQVVLLRLLLMGLCQKEFCLAVADPRADEKKAGGQMLLQGPMVLSTSMRMHTAADMPGQPKASLSNQLPHRLQKQHGATVQSGTGLLCFCSTALRGCHGVLRTECHGIQPAQAMKALCMAAVKQALLGTHTSSQAGW